MSVGFDDVMSLVPAFCEGVEEGITFVNATIEELAGVYLLKMRIYF